MSVNSAKNTITKWCGVEEKSNNLEVSKEILSESHSLCGLFTNRGPTKSVLDKTLQEAWSGRKPMSL